VWFSGRWQCDVKPRQGWDHGFNSIPSSHVKRSTGFIEGWQKGIIQATIEIVLSEQIERILWQEKGVIIEAIPVFCGIHRGISLSCIGCSSGVVIYEACK
jgi:hypothetical protein